LNPYSTRYATQLSVADAPPFTASLVTSTSEIAQYEEFVRSLAAEPGMLSPAFFLASVSPAGWRPLLVVVWQEQRIAGLLYCKERVVAGIGIRMAFGNDDLGTMVVARPEDAESVMVCGVRALLKHMFALRLIVSSAYLPVLKSFQADTDFSFYRRKAHAHLDLSRTFDKFLARLGPKTRRNFRYYRRKSEQAGNEFISALAPEEFFVAAQRLLPKAAYAIRSSKHAQVRHQAMIEAMPSPMLVGIRRASGQWIGLAGGWYVGQRAFLIMQLNDRTCERESLSIVLRSYLIEMLIHRGCRELVFWGGSSPPLTYYATYPVGFTAYLDARSLPWRVGRGAWGLFRKFAPTTFGRLLNSFVRGL
jgi:Acetyltransferase (GNAT) domain